MISKGYSRWCRPFVVISLARLLVFNLAPLQLFSFLHSWCMVQLFSLLLSRRLFSKIKNLKLFCTSWPSTTLRVNLSKYSLSVSFFSWMIAFRSTIVFGCFSLAVKWEVNSSHSSTQELMELSSSPLNHVIAEPFNVRTNNFLFTNLKARW